MSKKWYERLDQDDVSLLYQLATADFKLSKLSATTGVSYFILKKQLKKFKRDLLHLTSKETDFEDYLNFLVKQEILPRSIAQVLHQKHLDELER